MHALRRLAVPAVVLCAIAGFIALNPAGRGIGQGGVAIQTPDPLPEGLTGRLTYRTGRELVTVAFPDTVEVGRTLVQSDPRGQPSADGRWRAHLSCLDACTLTLDPADGETRTLRVDHAGAFAWSPSGSALAVSLHAAGEAPVLAVIEDPASGEPRTLVGGGVAGGFAWADGESLLVAISDGHAHALERVGLDGSRAPLAPLAAHARELYRSSGGRYFALTSDDAEGWRLHVYDAEAGGIVFSRAMGSDGPDGEPVVASPDVKGPMYIAWSPDGHRLAFGGGYEPPFIMTTIDLRTGAAVTSEFGDGYPGEIAWTRDGARIGVSTYATDRSRHETYVVDPETGEATHLISGCVILWSPDGRFLAVHGEKQPGIAIVDVETGLHGRLTALPDDVPVDWVD